MLSACAFTFEVCIFDLVLQCVQLDTVLAELGPKWILFVAFVEGSMLSMSGQDLVSALIVSKLFFPSFCGCTSCLYFIVCNCIDT